MQSQRRPMYLCGLDQSASGGETFVVDSNNKEPKSRCIACVHWDFFIVAHADVGCMMYQPLIDIGGNKLTYLWIK
nr:hypothetical protein CFP56_72456 [Quercus suber]